MAGLGTGIGSGSVASLPGMSAMVSTAWTPGMAQGRARIDRPDARMGMRAAHERRVQHARQLDVVDEARAAGEQGRIFDPRHAGAELPRAHVYAAPYMPAARAGGQAGLFIAAFWFGLGGLVVDGIAEPVKRRSRARSGQPSRPCVRARALDPAAPETNTVRDKAGADTPSKTITATREIRPMLMLRHRTQASPLSPRAGRGSG